MPKSTKTHRTSDVPPDEVYKQILLEAGEKYGFSPKLVGDIVDGFFESLIKAAARHGEILIPKHAKVYHYDGYSTIKGSPIQKLFFKISRRDKNIFKSILDGDYQDPKDSEEPTEKELKHSPVADTFIG